MPIGPGTAARAQSGRCDPPRAPAAGRLEGSVPLSPQARPRTRWVWARECTTEWRAPADRLLVGLVEGKPAKTG